MTTAICQNGGTVYSCPFWDQVLLRPLTREISKYRTPNMSSGIEINVTQYGIGNEINETLMSLLDVLELE